MRHEDFDRPGALFTRHKKLPKPAFNVDEVEADADGKGESDSGKRHGSLPLPNITITDMDNNLAAEVNDRANTVPDDLPLVYKPYQPLIVPPGEVRPFGSAGPIRPHIDFLPDPDPNRRSAQFCCITEDRVSFYVPTWLFHQASITLRVVVRETMTRRQAAVLNVRATPFAFVLHTLRQVPNWPWPARQELFPLIEHATTFARLYSLPTYSKRVARRAVDMLSNDPWALYAVSIVLEYPKLAAKSLEMIQALSHGPMPDDIRNVIQRRVVLFDYARAVAYHDANFKRAMQLYKHDLVLDRDPQLRWHRDCEEQERCTPFRTFAGEFSWMYAFVAEHVFATSHVPTRGAYMAKERYMREFLVMILPCARCVDTVVWSLTRVVYQYAHLFRALDVVHAKDVAMDEHPGSAIPQDYDPEDLDLEDLDMLDAE